MRKMKLQCECGKVVTVEVSGEEYAQRRSEGDYSIECPNHYDPIEEYNKQFNV